VRKARSRFASGGQSDRALALAQANGAACLRDYYAGHPFGEYLLVAVLSPTAKATSRHPHFDNLSMPRQIG
jgi:hypothetical protein